VDHIVPHLTLRRWTSPLKKTEMDDAPASPSPNVSEDEMDTDKEEDLLAYHGLHRDSSSDEDGFQHV